MSGGSSSGNARADQAPGAPAETEPARERPRFPKGYGVPETPEGMLEWRWAEERLERAKNYWICTTRPDGKPHARPIWGAWIDQSFFFDGGGRWSAYLRENPRMTVHLESGDEVVIVEGRVRKVTALEPEVFAAVQAQYGGKYEYRPEAPEGGIDPVGWTRSRSATFDKVVPHRYANVTPRPARPDGRLRRRRG